MDAGVFLVLIVCGNPRVTALAGGSIEQMIGQLKGETRFEWCPEGLNCEIWNTWPGPIPPRKF